MKAVTLFLQPLYTYNYIHNQMILVFMVAFEKILLLLTAFCKVHRCLYFYRKQYKLYRETFEEFIQTTNCFPIDFISSILSANIYICKKLSLFLSKEKP